MSWHLVARLFEGFALRGSGGWFSTIGAASRDVELVAVIGQLNLKNIIEIIKILRFYL
jgi:hypothetical protein